MVATSTTLSTASAAAPSDARSTPSPALRPLRTVAFVVSGAVVAGLASSAVALIARALGAADGFAPLMPVVYLPFVAVGLVAGVAGWRIVSSKADRPAAVLRVLVPVVLIVTRFIPGTTLLGGLSLSTMHLIVAAVAVLVAQRVAPVRPR